MLTGEYDVHERRGRGTYFEGSADEVGTVIEAMADTLADLFYEDAWNLNPEKPFGPAVNGSLVSRTGRL